MKKEILQFATSWVDLKGIVLSEMSQTERQIPHDFTYLWNPQKTTTKTQMNKQNKLIDTENRLMVAKEEAIGVLQTEIVIGNEESKWKEKGRKLENKQAKKLSISM